MTRERFYIWSGCLLICGVLSAESALAQSAGGGAASKSVEVLQIVFVILAAGFGSALGWLLSSEAKPYRKMLYAVIAVAAAAIILFGSTPISMATTVIAALLGFIIAFGRKAKEAFSGMYSPPTTFGSSRWATPDDLQERDLFGTDAIRIGQASNEQGELEWVSYKGDRHLLTVAPTRAGKGTTQIIPNLLTYEGSMLVIDPKGENALLTAVRRKSMGQNVHIVDPWGIVKLDASDFETGEPIAVTPSGDVKLSDPTKSCFNPMDWLDVRDPDCAENAMLLASAIVVEGNSKDRFGMKKPKLCCMVSLCMWQPIPKRMAKGTLDASEISSSLAEKSWMSSLREWRAPCTPLFAALASAAFKKKKRCSPASWPRSNPTHTF